MDVQQFNFHVIQQLDSTNKYAMEMLSEGLAQHLDAWFAIDQTQGKGQRGKNWLSKPGENITFSVVIQPQYSFQKNPFAFNAFITLVCRDFIASILQLDVQIKWPNDLFVNDRKAGGILIENRYLGKNWKWAVVGIGINVNQIDFPDDLFAATSFKKITNKDFDPIQLARLLHKDLVEAYENSTEIEESQIWERYNQYLFKKKQICSLRINGNKIIGTISHVNDQGFIVVIQNGVEYTYQVGEIEWLF